MTKSHKKIKQIKTVKELEILFAVPEFAIPLIEGFVAEYYYQEYFTQATYKPCKHCIKKGKAKPVSIYKRYVWLIPRALLVVTKDPEVEAVVCLDCLDKRLSLVHEVVPKPSKVKKHTAKS